ncbi:hypothetical protein PRZ48_009194 [Zasmidium cellare]|uniref:S-adenosyl-L-methionine-dependent methyltransferase n=1 Tax=Zasmidium cellare TaxID=395010 RepID=A0ABR0EB23_ZASCE|nr:hypothetical protein PRZ48_009194 [Zasmidium cellare]
MDICNLVKELVIQASTISAIFTYRSTFTKGSESPLALFCLGLAASYFCRFVLPLRYNPTNPFTSEFTRRRLKRNKGRGRGNGKLDAAAKADMYGLEHTYFNMNLEPETMWENVGYWKDANGHFPTACRDLFEKMLTITGALDNGPTSILELGCGCVETAYHMLSTRPQNLVNYVGLNINGIQARFCQERLEDWKLKHGKPEQLQTLRAFNADAAQPATWSKEVRETVESFMIPSPTTPAEKAPARKWLFCVDCLYHFRAGREGILTYAREKFGTSLVATDFLIPEKLSFVERWILWATLTGIQVPWWNRLTKQQYIDLLVRSGYDRNSIQIIDITEHAFTPYADFLSAQTAKWDEVGGSVAAIRPFVHWGWALRYWGWAGTLRSVIIVAHPKK